MIQNLQLIMTTNPLLPVVGGIIGTITTQPTFGVPSLDSFSLNLKYVDLGTNAVLNSVKGGKIYMKASTYTNSNASVPQGTLGQASYPLQIRNSSVKSLFWYQALTAQTGANPNGSMDAINNGCCTKQQVVIGGSRYPQRELNPSQRPAECIHQLQQAWGLGGDWNQFGGTLSRESYGSTLPSVTAGSDQSLTQPGNLLRPAPSGSDSGPFGLIKAPSSHFLGIDLEKSAGVLFQGVNTRPSPPFVELTTSVATAAVGTLYGFGLSDVVLEIDVGSKSIVSYI
jgi:hypothetical protein